MVEQDVYDFINKVKTKAMKAIMEKYEKEHWEAVDEYLDQTPKLKDLIERAQKAIDETAALENEIRGNFNANYHIGPLFLTNGSKDVKRLLFNYGWSTPFITTEKLTDIHKNFLTEKEKVATEYDKIKKLCQEKKTAQKAVAFLKSLGFDVSYFDKLQPTVDLRQSVNTDILFPCKEKGV